MTNLPSFADSIIVGVVSGILTTIAIGAFAQFIRKVVLPWYQSITYSGIDISGDWFGVDENLTQIIEVKIKQSARTLKGSAVFSYREGGNDPEERDYEGTRSFSLSGLTQDRFVTLTLRHTDGRRLGINCYLLEIIGDGRRMAGVFSFYCITTNQIEHLFQILYRDKNAANRAAREATEEDLPKRRKELLEELKDNERKIESIESNE